MMDCVSHHALSARNRNNFLACQKNLQVNGLYFSVSRGIAVCGILNCWKPFGPGTGIAGFRGAVYQGDDL